MASSPTTQADQNMPWVPNPDLGETDDDALILWFLSLTPTERLEAHQDFVDGNWARREGRPAGGLLTLKRLAEREKKKDSV